MYLGHSKLGVKFEVSTVRWTYDHQWNLRAKLHFFLNSRVEYIKIKLYSIRKVLLSCLRRGEERKELRARRSLRAPVEGAPLAPETLRRGGLLQEDPAAAGLLVVEDAVPRRNV